MNRINLTNLKISTIIAITTAVTVVVFMITNTNVINTILKGLYPVVTSFCVAYFLEYLVTMFEKRLKLSRIPSVILSILTVVLFIYASLSFLIPSLTQAVTQLYSNIKQLNIDIDSNVIHIIKWLNLDVDTSMLEFEKIKTQLLNDLFPIVQKLTEISGPTITKLAISFKNMALSLISGLVSVTIAVYMVLDKKNLLTLINRASLAFMSSNAYNRSRHVISHADRIFKNFVLGKLLDSLIIGLLTYVVLAIFQFEYAVLIAFFVGVTNMIPYFGPFIGAIPAILITLVASFDNPIRVVYIALIILIIQQLDGLVIGPRILGDSVGVAPFWIIIAVTVGGATYGVVGMFLGVPTVVLLKTIVEEMINKNLHVKGICDEQSSS